MRLLGLTVVALAGAALLVPAVACSPGGDPASQTGNLDAAEEEPCVPPKIQFVVDASASMLEPIGGEGVSEDLTKWQALSGAVARVTTTHERAALYGLTTFPGAAGGCTAGDMQIAPAPNNEAAINQKIAELSIAPDAATPAGQTLMAVSHYEEMQDDSQERFVVFISDGWQFCDVPNASGEGAPACFNQGDCEAMGLDNCSSCNSCQIASEDPACEGQNGDGCFCVRNWPLLGVQALAEAGIKTYVVGFGHNVDATTLNQAAVAAGTELPGCDPESEEPSCFLTATSTEQLGDALEKIMLRLSSVPCAGGCGIEGKKQCTLAGWSECAAPESVACAADCGAEGVQLCSNGVLGECDAQCIDTGGAGGQPVATGGSGAGGSGQGAGGSGQGAGGSGEGAGGAGAGGPVGGGSVGGASSGGEGGAGAGAPEPPPPSYGGSSSDPWDDDDYGDDYYGGEEGGGSSGSDPSVEDESGCSFAVGGGNPAHIAWMLGIALTLWRRRRQGARG